MKRIKAIAGILCIFALGAMTGALGTDLLLQHRIEKFHDKGPPPIGPMFMKRVGHRLGLTAEQRAAVEPILNDLESDLGNIRKTVDPQIKGAFDAAFARMGEHLTEDQKKQLDKLKTQFPKRCRQNKRVQPHENR